MPSHVIVYLRPARELYTRGLYSPEMGPATMRARNCSTCGLSFRECPGHFGHIKLCVPVWNPQLFNTLYRLLRYKCFNCNRLKHDRMAVQTLIVQIQLDTAGQSAGRVEAAGKAGRARWQRRPRKRQDSASRGSRPCCAPMKKKYATWNH